MNIKALLLTKALFLSSTAIAFSIHQAPVNKPIHPVNKAIHKDSFADSSQINKCSSHGEGYFYIESVKTCFKIGGYVRIDGILLGKSIKYQTRLTSDDRSWNEYHDYKSFGLDYKDSGIQTQLSLQPSIIYETELGTLTAFSKVNFTYGNIGGFSLGNTYELKEAWIQLGGFTLGKTDSVFNSFSSNAGKIIHEAPIHYGPQDTINLASYIYDTQNGFSFVGSLEQGKRDHYTNTVAPNLVAGVKYTSGLGVVTGVVGFDSVDEVAGSKIRIDLSLNEKLSIFAMGGFGSDDKYQDEDMQRLKISFYKPWKGRWALWTGGTYKLSDKLALNFQGSYAEGIIFDNERKPEYGVAANFDYQLVKNLHIMPELGYFIQNTPLEYMRNSFSKEEVFYGSVRFEFDF